MLLGEYIKKLEKLASEYGENLELVYYSDPNNEAGYWVTDDPEPCVFDSERMKIKNLLGVTKEEINCIAIN